jgi:transcriptional regulator with XRE-family HTH domain
MASFTYKSYNFVDKDPIIDEIRTLYEDSGVNYKWLHENAGVATGTLTNWFNGQTKRPQAATLNAVARALGYKLGFVPHEAAIHIVPALPQPKPRNMHSIERPVSVRHVVQMKKYRRGK